jgi:hypothetical protein
MRPVVYSVFAAAFLAGCETVVVSMVEVADVEIVPGSITLVAGQSESASAVLRERGGLELLGRSVTWTVDDPEIATVTPDGIVAARSPGNTIVRASSEGVTGLAEVRVLAGEEDPDREEDEPDRDDEDEPDRDDDVCDVIDQLLTDVTLERGVTCVFTDVRVRGRLELREGSRLVATRLIVDGPISSSGAASVTLDDSRVYGDVKLEKGGSITIRRSQVSKKVELIENLGAITVSDTRIEETLKVDKNRGGPFSLLRNTSRNLECKENDPAPTGSGNVVSGRDRGQCEGL